jgi:hypothetical protein
MNLLPVNALRAVSRSVVAKERMSAIAKIFIVVLLIVVTEGAVRKWVSAEFTTPLVLLRDVLALWCVALAIQGGGLRLNKTTGALLGSWSVLVMGWALLQAVVNEIPLTIVAIGLRFWLLYLWFAVAVAVSVSEYDFRQIMRSILVLMVLMAPLVVAQYLQPPAAFINKQVSDDENDLIFTVIFGVVRTTGTFSFTLGFTTFLALATPFALALLTAKADGPKQKYWKVLAVGAMLVGTMVSGSRTAFVTFFVVMIGYLIYLFFLTRIRLRLRTYVSIIGGTLLVALLSLTFSSALDAIEERAEGAAESEDVAQRVIEMFVGNEYLRENFEIIGNGIGYGANFAGVVLTGERAFLNGETEIDRTLLSGGLLGLFFQVLKLLVCGWGIFRSARIARNGTALPLLLWISSAIGLLTWAVTGQLTANAMGYTLAGLALAAMRFPRVGAIR